MNMLENTLAAISCNAKLMEVLAASSIISDINCDKYRTSYVPFRYPSMNAV